MTVLEGRTLLTTFISRDLEDWWTKDARWGLCVDGRNDDGDIMLTLLDSDGCPSYQQLDMHSANYLINLLLREDEDTDWQTRWDAFAGVVSR